GKPAAAKTSSTTAAKTAAVPAPGSPATPAIVAISAAANPADENNHSQDDQRSYQRPAAAPAAHRRTFFRDIFTPDRPDHRMDCRLHAAGVVVLPKSRCHFIANDLITQGIRKNAFEPFANFDSYLTIAHGNHEQYTVITIRFTQSEIFGNAECKVFDRDAIQTGHRENRYLIGC